MKRNPVPCLAVLAACALVLSGGGCLAGVSPAGGSPGPAVNPAGATISDDGKTSWFDALDIGLEGQGWTGFAHPYDRLPAEAEGKVPAGVWKLSRHAAGLSVGFVTDSPTVAVRWSLRLEELAMNHMAATGVSGVDLYVRRGGVWRWVATGRPEKVRGNEKTLVSNAPRGTNEYRMYLPLYNAVDSVEIGVKPGSRLTKAPGYPAGRDKPMLFWGTSILQGGCASRPGMAYPAIIGRWLDRPAINLGFSGQGKMDPEVTSLVARVDASVFVIDCAPNMTKDLVAERTEPLVRALRAAHPETPIVLVENIVYQQAWFLADSAKSYKDKNDALRAAFRRLERAGLGNLYYIPGDNLLGADSEATVDGTHPTDLGFLRMAEAITPFLRKILK